MTKKIAFRIGIPVVILYAASLIALLAFAFHVSEEKQQKDRMIGLKVYAEFMIDALEQKMNLNDINAAEITDTEQADILEEILHPVNITEENGNSIQFNMDVVYDNNIEKPYIIGSSELEYKSPLPQRYIADLTEAIKESKIQQTKQTVITSGEQQQFGYLVIPAVREEDDMFYIASFMADQDTQDGPIWNRNVYLTIICGSVLLLLLVFVIYRMLRPIRQLSLTMEQIAAGNYELPRVRYPNNELGDMWISMQKMCKGIGTQLCAKSSVLKYYHRFLPKGFEQLFEKNSLSDVLPGETRVITATVGMVYLTQRGTQFRDSMWEKNMGDLFKWMKLLVKANSRKGGILLSNGRPDSVKVVYPQQEDSLDRAIQFGIDSIHALDIQPFVMLYTGQFSCGLGGTAEQFCPFVNSVDLECLCTYTEELKRLGIKMVLVETLAGGLHRGYTARMVGRLSIGTEREVFWIYEILDACGKRERQGKHETQEKFRQALDLFYKNDFYLARNGFNEVLKEYAEDGVAKWYLFLCEDRLNEAATESGSHDLFPRQ